jgi:hypothetical protein
MSKWFDWFDLLTRHHVRQLTNRPLTTTLLQRHTTKPDSDLE